MVPATGHRYPGFPKFNQAKGRIVPHPDITPAFLDHVAAVIAATTPAVATFCDDNRTGGCVYICDATGNQLLHKMVGAPDPSKMAKYRSYSREKAERLLAHPEHLASRQSRDEKLHKYAGAIRLPSSGIIISFSGFSESDDELFAAVIGMILFRASYAPTVTECLGLALSDQRWQAMKLVFKQARPKAA